MCNINGKGHIRIINIVALGSLSRAIIVGRLILDGNSCRLGEFILVNDIGGLCDRCLLCDQPLVKAGNGIGLLGRIDGGRTAVAESPECRLCGRQSLAFGQRIDLLLRQGEFTACRIAGFGQFCLQRCQATLNGVAIFVNTDSAPVAIGTNGLNVSAGFLIIVSSVRNIFNLVVIVGCCSGCEVHTVDIESIVAEFQLEHVGIGIVGIGCFYFIVTALATNTGVVIVIAVGGSVVSCRCHTAVATVDNIGFSIEHQTGGGQRNDGDISMVCTFLHLAQLRRIDPAVLFPYQLIALCIPETNLGIGGNSILCQLSGFGGGGIGGIGLDVGFDLAAVDALGRVGNGAVGSRRNGNGLVADSIAVFIHNVLHCGNSHAAIHILLIAALGFERQEEDGIVFGCRVFICHGFRDSFPAGICLVFFGFGIAGDFRDGISNDHLAITSAIDVLHAGFDNRTVGIRLPAHTCSRQIDILLHHFFQIQINRFGDNIVLLGHIQGDVTRFLRDGGIREGVLSRFAGIGYPPGVCASAFVQNEIIVSRCYFGAFTCLLGFRLCTGYGGGFLALNLFRFKDGVFGAVVNLHFGLCFRAFYLCGLGSALHGKSVLTSSTGRDGLHDSLTFLGKRGIHNFENAVIFGDLTGHGNRLHTIFNGGDGNYRLRIFLLRRNSNHRQLTYA